MQSTTTKRPYAQLRQAYKSAQAALKSFLASADLEDPAQYAHFQSLRQTLAQTNRARHAYVWNQLPPLQPGQHTPPLTQQHFPTPFHQEPQELYEFIPARHIVAAAGGTQINDPVHPTVT